MPSRAAMASAVPGWSPVIITGLMPAEAVAAGAEIIIELKDEDYGGRGYTARDSEGNLWSFGTYRPEA